MSAIELNAEVIERLGAGDAIFAAEAAKGAALATGDAINTPAAENTPPAERLEQLLGRADPHAEELLAAIFPLIEYADELALEIIPRCLVYLAEQTSLALRDNERNERGGVVAVGRLIWAMTTYALHCGRLGAVAASSRALIHNPSSDSDAKQLIAVSTLRYPDALGGNAGNSYRDYREWVAGRELVRESYKLFASELDGAFAEADLLLALRAAAERGRVYSGGLNAETAQRFAVRARDSKHARILAETFGTTTDGLEGVLEAAYARLERDQNIWDSPPRTLFGDTDS